VHETITEGDLDSTFALATLLQLGQMLYDAWLAEQNDLTSIRRKWFQSLSEQSFFTKEPKMEI